MAESLLAIVLATSSSKGSNLVFHWPSHPATSARLTRPRPRFGEKISFLDNSWTTATQIEIDSPHVRDNEKHFEDWDYEWKRPQALKERQTPRAAKSHPGSRRASPSKGSYSCEPQNNEHEYDNLLGYPAEFLASILCPKDDMCHQKFELIVDDLAFIGHPVCAEADGLWRFKKERGRGGVGDDASDAHSPTQGQKKANTTHTFHLVLVIDLPDPSSSASGNVFKYFHVLYEQIAFTVTAVLFQEQVMNQFVDVECEGLTHLRELSYSHGTPFANFVKQALDTSSLARAMKSLFEAIKANSIARLIINDVGFEVQLPPELDHLLHAEDENPDFIERPDPESVSWGPELSFGWCLPSLAPWKSLLLYDPADDLSDLKLNLSRPGLSTEDHALAEGLLQFLETVSIFDSLNVVAHSLDWDLERQVYPTVRWLVYHRRAKIADTVHRGLRTIFVLSSRMTKPLPELAKDFARDFPQPAIPSLPKLFAMISNPKSTISEKPLSPPSRTQSQMAAHSTQQTAPLQTTSPDFYTCVVKSKDLVPLYQDVLVWLLRRGLIVALHLHVRLVATPAIKELVRRRRARAARKRLERMNQDRGRDRQRVKAEGNGDSSGASALVLHGISGEPLIPVTQVSARRPSNQSAHKLNVQESGIAQSFRQREGLVHRGRRSSRRRFEDDDNIESLRSGSRLRYALDFESEELELDEEALASEDFDEDDDFVAEKWEKADDNNLPSIIPEPGQATPLQRKWIEAMSEGKDREVVQRFQLINPFFDGKRTDDEIMFIAEITRRQLRDVLQQYEEYLLTSLHPA